MSLPLYNLPLADKRDSKAVGPHLVEHVARSEIQLNLKNVQVLSEGIEANLP